MNLFLLMISLNFSIGLSTFKKLPSEFREGFSGSTPDMTHLLSEMTLAEQMTTSNAQPYSMDTELSGCRASSTLKTSLLEQYASDITGIHKENITIDFTETKGILRWIMGFYFSISSLPSVLKLVSKRKSQILDEFNKQINNGCENLTLDEDDDKEKILNLLRKEWAVHGTNNRGSVPRGDPIEIFGLKTDITLAGEIEKHLNEGVDYRLTLDPYVKRELERDEVRKRRTEILLREEFENLKRSKEMEKQEEQELERLAVYVVNRFLETLGDDFLDKNGDSVLNYKFECDFDEKVVSPGDVTVEILKKKLNEFLALRLQNNIKFIIGGVLAENKSEFFYMDNDPITMISSAIFDGIEFRHPTKIFTLLQLKFLYAKGKIATLLYQPWEAWTKAGFMDDLYETILIFTDAYTSDYISIFKGNIKTLAQKRADKLFPCLLKKSVREGFTDNVVKAMKFINYFRSLPMKENQTPCSSDLELARTAAKVLCIMRYAELKQFGDLYSDRYLGFSELARMDQGNGMYRLHELTASLGEAYSGSH